MSVGNHPMSDGSHGPPLDWPRMDGVPASARPILVLLCLWRDGRGSCDPTHEEIAERLDIHVRSVRRHIKWLCESSGFLKRARSRERDGEARLNGYRYWLNLEKLGLTHAAARREVADKSCTSGRLGSGQMVQVADKSCTGGSGQTEQVADKSCTSGDGGSGQIVHPPPGPAGEKSEQNQADAGASRERARAFLFSDFLSVSYPDEGDGRREKAERILSACGPMLGDPAKQSRVLESLAEVLAGPWDGFDFEADVLPAVAHRTRAAAKTKLWNFVLVTSNVEEWRTKRLREAARAGHAAKALAAKAPVGMTTERRIAFLRRSIGQIEGGENPLFLLPNDERRLDGHWLDDAFARVRAEFEAELRALGGVDVEA